MKLQKKWRFALGNFLVVSDPLVKSDAIVVLDGDPMDERLLHVEAPGRQQDIFLRVQ